MKIGIDARLWNQTGVGRYVRNICISLGKIDKKNSYVLFIREEDEKYVKEAIKNKNWKIVITNIKWHSLSEQLRLPRLIKKEKLDLMHFTYQQSVPIFYNKPYILTIHDLIKHHFITGQSSTNPYWLLGFKMLGYKILINIATKKARKVITVSEFTKDDVIDHLVVNKGNVEVIYEAADDFISDSGFDIDIQNYFLYVGNIYPHKNAEKMVKAFKNIAEKKDVKLVFVGKEDNFYKRLMKDTSKLVKTGKIIFDFKVGDRKLSGYYKNAICLVRPSFMEGFSLPPLEAQADGCLVLASNIPVHREIFEDSIIYFNPQDFVDIEDKMNYVLNLDKSVKEKLLKKGRGVVGKFSWEKAAGQTLNIYESCSSEG